MLTPLWGCERRRSPASGVGGAPVPQVRPIGLAAPDRRQDARRPEVRPDAPEGRQRGLDAVVSLGSRVTRTGTTTEASRSRPVMMVSAFGGTRSSCSNERIAPEEQHRSHDAPDGADAAEDRDTAEEDGSDDGELETERRVGSGAREAHAVDDPGEPAHQAREDEQPELHSGHGDARRTVLPACSARSRRSSDRSGSGGARRRTRARARSSSGGDVRERRAGDVVVAERHPAARGSRPRWCRRAAPSTARGRGRACRS